MQGALDLKDPNMDGVLDIYDLGVVITHLITKMSEKARSEQGGGSVPPKRRPVGASNSLVCPASCRPNEGGMKQDVNYHYLTP